MGGWPSRRQAHGELIDAFDAVVDDRPDVDRHEVFRRLRAELPIFRSERLGAWVLSRYDEVHAVLAHPTRFEPLKEGPGAPIFGRSFLQMSGREHNKKAGIVAKRIRSPRAVKEDLEGLVDGIAQRQVDELPFDEPVDLRARYAMWIPLRRDHGADGRRRRLPASATGTGRSRAAASRASPTRACARRACRRSPRCRSSSRRSSPSGAPRRRTT